MKTRSNRSWMSAPSPRSFGSKACASIPFFFKAPSTLSPLFRDTAIARLEIGRRALAEFSGARDRQHLRDDVPGFRPVAAGVHRERSPDRPGYTGEEFRAFEAARRRKARHLGARDRGFGANQIALEVHRTVRAVHQHDRPVKPAVTHEQIASKSHE